MAIPSYDDFTKTNVAVPAKTSVNSAPPSYDEYTKGSMASNAPPSYEDYTRESAKPAGTLGAYGQTIKQAFKGIPAYVNAAIEGDQPYTQEDISDKLIAENEAEQQKFINGPNADAPVLGGLAKERDIRQGADSMAGTFASMAPAAAGAAYGSLFGPVGTVVGGVVGAGAGLYGMKRYDENQFIRQNVEKGIGNANAKRAWYGEPELSQQDAAKEAIALQDKLVATGDPQTHGLWEAGSETLGNVAQLGLALSPLKGAAGLLKPIASPLARAALVGAGKALGIGLTENMEEQATRIGQNPIQKKYGLPEATAAETAKQTTIQMLPLMGLGGAGGAYQGYKYQPEEVEVPEVPAGPLAKAAEQARVQAEAQQAQLPLEPEDAAGNLTGQSPQNEALNESDRTDQGFTGTGIGAGGSVAQNGEPDTGNGVENGSPATRIPERNRGPEDALRAATGDATADDVAVANTLGDAEGILPDNEYLTNPPQPTGVDQNVTNQETSESTDEKNANANAEEKRLLDAEAGTKPVNAEPIPESEDSGLAGVETPVAVDAQAKSAQNETGDSLLQPAAEKSGSVLDQKAQKLAEYADGINAADADLQALLEAKKEPRLTRAQKLEIKDQLHNALAKFRDLTNRHGALSDEIAGEPTVAGVDEALAARKQPITEETNDGGLRVRGISGNMAADYGSQHGQEQTPGQVDSRAAGDLAEVEPVIDPVNVGQQKDAAQPTPTQNEVLNDRTITEAGAAGGTKEEIASVDAGKAPASAGEAVSEGNGGKESKTSPQLDLTWSQLESHLKDNYSPDEKIHVTNDDGEITDTVSGLLSEINSSQDTGSNEVLKNIKITRLQDGRADLPNAVQPQPETQLIPATAQPTTNENKNVKSQNPATPDKKDQKNQGAKEQEVAKQPWEMTSAEYLADQGKNYPDDKIDSGISGFHHKQSVESALRRGEIKADSPSVAEYPDLAAEYAGAAEPAAAKEQEYIEPSFPAKDKDLTSEKDFEDRIQSLHKQIQKLDDITTPRDSEKHNEKYKKLAGRRDGLLTKLNQLKRTKAKEQEVKNDVKKEDKTVAEAQSAAPGADTHTGGVVAHGDVQKAGVAGEVAGGEVTTQRVLRTYTGAEPLDVVGKTLGFENKYLADHELNKLAATMGYKNTKHLAALNKAKNGRVELGEAVGFINSKMPKYKAPVQDVAKTQENIHDELKAIVADAGKIQESGLRPALQKLYSVGGELASYYDNESKSEKLDIHDWDSVVSQLVQYIKPGLDAALNSRFNNEKNPEAKAVLARIIRARAKVKKGAATSKPVVQTPENAAAAELNGTHSVPYEVEQDKLPKGNAQPAKTGAAKTTEGGYKLKLKYQLNFEAGMKEGAVSVALNSNLDPRATAIKTGLHKANEIANFVKGFEIGAGYLEDYRSDKNLTQAAIKKGDVSPVDFEMRYNGQHTYAEELKKEPVAAQINTQAAKTGAAYVGQQKDAAQPTEVKPVSQQPAKEYPLQSKTEMREWLVRKIDEAIVDAGDDSAAELVKKGLAKTYGHVNFAIPGGAKFRVLATKEHLQEFKKKILASSGFRETSNSSGERKPSTRQTDSLVLAKRYLAEAQQKVNEPKEALAQEYEAQPPEQDQLLTTVAEIAVNEGYSQEQIDELLKGAKPGVRAKFDAFYKEAIDEVNPEPPKGGKKIEPAGSEVKGTHSVPYEAAKQKALAELGKVEPFAVGLMAASDSISDKRMDDIVARERAEKGGYNNLDSLSDQELKDRIKRQESLPSGYFGGLTKVGKRWVEEYKKELAKRASRTIDGEQGPQFSKAQPENPDTFGNANEARLHLVKAFGPGVNNLVDKGVLHFTVGKAFWPEAARRDSRGGEEAVYINGEAYIDLKATPKERMIPVLLHEIGEHHNIRKILGTKGYEDLQKHIANLARVPGSKAEEVWNKVKRVYALEEGREDFVSEVIAKLGEVDPKAVWYKRLLSQIKAFLMTHGLARGFITGTLTEKDMHALLVASLHSAARGRVKGAARFYGGEHVLASFAGEHAETADKYQLANAQQRLAGGEDAEKVRKDTGWHQGVDGKWRFEIDDSEARLRNLGDLQDRASSNELGFAIAPLADVLDHPTLFAAYPELKNAKVRYNSKKWKSGFFSAGANGNPDVFEISVEDELPTLLHEIQHGIQNKEGFAKGGSPDQFRGMQLSDADYRKVSDEVFDKQVAVGYFKKAGENGTTAQQEMAAEAKLWGFDTANARVKELVSMFDSYKKANEWYLKDKEWLDNYRKVNFYDANATYRKLAGEVEARNVEARKDLTKAQRKTTPPSVTQDVKDNDVIIVWNGKEMASVPAWHGSPHDHDKFDSGKIGTGEGAQVFGHGHYFTDKKEIAEFYKKGLGGYAYKGEKITNKVISDVFATDTRNALRAVMRYGIDQAENMLSDPADIKALHSIKPELSEAGKLYNVELAPEQDELLDWDKPLIEQSEKVRAALDKLIEVKGYNLGITKAYRDAYTRDELIGKDIINFLSRSSNDKAASDYLHSLGIRGIRYKAEAGKSDANNYVIFSDDDVSITAKFSRTEATKAASEKRVKDLFEGATPERVHGVKILDKSDILDMLGLGDKNVLIAETHGLVRGRSAHAGFSESDWNKVPDYIDNPIAVFKQADKTYRFIGPELINGDPVVIAVMPNEVSREEDSQYEEGKKIHILKTAFAKDRVVNGVKDRLPIHKWILDGDLVYVDTTKAAKFNKDTGFQLPTVYREIPKIAEKVVERNKALAKAKKPLLEVVDIKSDRDFAKYKAEEKKSLAAGTRADTIHSAGHTEQQNSNSTIPENGGEVKFSRTEAAYTEATITIDGKERPATNSNGRRIAQTGEGLRNFWKWFGDSKVVDGEGRPLVVYHGTTADFSEFKPSYFGKSDDGFFGKGFYFGSKEDANRYAGVKGSPNVIPSYLLIKKVLNINDDTGENSDWIDLRLSDLEAFSEKLSDGNYQGITYQNTKISDGKLDKQYFVFDSNQIKSAIGNNGDFSAESNDIRFSRIDDTEQESEQESEQDRAQGAKKAVKSRMRTLGDLLSKQGNAFLSVLQMQEQNETTLPGIAVYADGMHARRTVIDTTLQAADRVLKKWRLLSKGVNGKLAETMHASTLADVDATRDWSGVTQTVSLGNRAGDKGIVYKAHTQAKLMPKRRAALMAQAEAINNRDANPLRPDLYSATDALFRTEAGAQEYLALLDAAEKAQTSYRAGKYQDENISRKVEHAKVLTGFAELPAPARDVYRETHALHTQLADEKLDVLTERVSESIFNGEKRAALNALIRLKFESNKLDFYYAPLARFGDHWYYGKNAEGKPVFETFGNTTDRDEAAKAFEKAGGTAVEAGTSIKEMANLKRDGGSDSFVTDVIKLIDQSGIDSEQSKALQDEIYQMYLSTLPEVSLRHSSQHRKGTLGFEKDAMKAFANAMHHSASQLANMKEGRQMEQALDELGAVHAMSQSSAKREEGQREIDAAQMLLADWEELSQDGALDELMAQAEDDDRVKLLKTAKGLLKKFGVSDEHDAASALENHSEIMAKRIAQSKLLDTPEVRAKAANVIAELLKNYAALTHTETGAMDQVAAYARQFGFIYMLGFGISSGAVNLLQTPIVAMPVVQARYGIASTASAFRKAYADFGEAVTLAFHKDEQGNYDSRDSDGNASISEVLKKRLAGVAPESPEGRRLRAEITMLKNRKDDGTIGRTQTHDVINVGKEGEEYGGPLLELSKKMGWMFHHGERLNREVTLLAAFRASLDGNQALKDGKMAYLTALEQAEDYARTITNDSHLEYSPENAARIFRGWPAGIALQFKKYSQGMLYLWAKNVKASLKEWKSMPYGTEAEKTARDAAQQKAEEAKHTLAGLFVMQVAVSGAFGLPLTGAMAVLIDGLANLFDPDDDDDKPYDVRKNARIMLTEHFGETIATAVTKGFVNAATPLNLADRTELANVLFRDNLQDLEGKDQMTSWLASLFGPTGGIAQRVWTGLGLVSDGEFGRGIEQLLPKFASDVVQAGRFAAEGARSLNDVKLKDMAPTEVAQKALGFGSSSLEEKYFYRGAEKEDESAIRDARSKLLHKAAQAVMDKEPVPWDDIKAWKRKHPGAAIEKANIMASVRTSRSNEKKRGDKGYYVNPKILLEGEDDD